MTFQPSRCKLAGKIYKRYVTFFFLDDEDEAQLFPGGLEAEFGIDVREGINDAEELIRAIREQDSRVESDLIPGYTWLPAAVSDIEFSKPEDRDSYENCCADCGEGSSEGGCQGSDQVEDDDESSGQDDHEAGRNGDSGES
jgi:hypothetical protein